MRFQINPLILVLHCSMWQLAFTALLLTFLKTWETVALLFSPIQSSAICCFCNSPPWLLTVPHGFHPRQPVGERQIFVVTDKMWHPVTWPGALVLDFHTRQTDGVSGMTVPPGKADRYCKEPWNDRLWCMKQAVRALYTPQSKSKNQIGMDRQP